MMMMGMMMEIMMLLLQGCRHGWSCALALLWCPPLQPGHAYCIHLQPAWWQASPAARQPGSQSGMHSCMPRPLANVTPTRNAFYLSCMQKKKKTELKEKIRKNVKNAQKTRWQKKRKYLWHTVTQQTHACVCVCVFVYIYTVCCCTIKQTRPNAANSGLNPFK